MPQGALPLLAFYGGSFNPVHLGHLNTARFLAKMLPQSRIIFLPNSSPPHKDTAKLSYSTRREMLAYAIKECLPECDEQGKSRYGICDLEADPSERHYTVDTLHQLKELYPQNELGFIMGWDSLITLDQWRQGLELHQLAKLIVFKRPGLASAAMPPSVQESLKQYPEHYLILSNPEFDVSSSSIRAQIAQASPEECTQDFPKLTGLVPSSVRKLIAQYGYYR